MTTSDRAVRKASRERLLRDFAWAARIIDGLRLGLVTYDPADVMLRVAAAQTSRTRYACLMTAFGQ